MSDWYLKCYDMAHQDSYQSVIDEETGRRLLSTGNYEVSPMPFPDVPIKSRYASERYGSRS